MENKTAINKKILAILWQVEENHPELSGYLNEMPVTLPDQERPVIDDNSLQAFYQSLQVLVSMYTVTHRAPQAWDMPGEVNHVRL